MHIFARNGDYCLFISCSETFFLKEKRLSVDFKQEQRVKESGGMCSVQEFSLTLVAQPLSGRGQ